MPSVNLKVSANGNGVGQIILNHKTLNGQTRVTLDIHPKMWNPNPLNRISKLNIDELDNSTQNHLHCYETQVIQVVSNDYESLNGFVSQLIAVEPDGMSGEENGHLTTLFTEIGHISGETLPITEIDPPASSVWDLLKELDENSQELVAGLIRIPNYEDQQIDLLSWSGSLLKHSAVELILGRLFLQKLEKRSHLLKPKFVELEVKGTRFKGRVQIRSLMQYSQRIRANFNSQVSDMTNDNDGNRLLLGAVQVLSKTILDTPIFSPRVMRLRKFFTGVSLLPHGELITLAKSFKHKRSMVGYGELLFLARLIILRLQPGIGDEKQHTNSGLATGMYLSSARLWEIILSERRLSENWTIEPYKKPLPIREKDTLDGTNQKEPDLCVMDRFGNIIALVDAKYKNLDFAPKLGKMPNSDQYQQYAYSAASGLPSLFIYCSQNDYLGFDTDKIQIAHSNVETRIGVIAIPFPKDSNLELWWNEAEPWILESLKPIIRH